MQTYPDRTYLSSHPAFAGFAVDSDGRPCVYRNEYACSCGHEWSDEWSCACDDRCPQCDTEIEPEETTWVGPDDPAAKALWESLEDVQSDDQAHTQDGNTSPSAKVMLGLLKTLHSGAMARPDLLLTYALIDLRHIADMYDLDFSQSDRDAYKMYLAEKQDQGFKPVMDDQRPDQTDLWRILGSDLSGRHSTQQH